MINGQIESMQTSAIIAVSVPPGATVYIDGVPILEQGAPTTPTIVHSVPSGPHVVTFRLTGYFDEMISVNIPKGGYLEVATRLRPI